MTSDSLYSHILCGILNSMQLQSTIGCNRKSNWGTSNSSKCSSDCSINSSVHVLPAGQMILPFKYSPKYPT